MDGGGMGKGRAALYLAALAMAAVALDIAPNLVSDIRKLVFRSGGSV